MPPNVVINKEGGRWVVLREGTDTPVSTHASFDDAMSTGRQLAAQGSVDLVYEDESGNTQREAHERD